MSDATRGHAHAGDVELHPNCRCSVEYDHDSPRWVEGERGLPFYLVPLRWSSLMTDQGWKSPFPDEPPAIDRIAAAVKVHPVFARWIAEENELEAFLDRIVGPAGRRPS